jgi:predicted signal transduction protein with EAL and GGDEF domain
MKRIEGTERVTDEAFDEYFSIPRPEACKMALDRLMLAFRQKKGVVVKIYLEDFKSFNDMFGMPFGDMLIREITRFLCSIEGADVYRSAGVEFICIFEDLNPPDGIDLLKVISKRFDASWRVGSLDCMCLANIGAVRYPGQAANTQDLLEHLAHTVAHSAIAGPNKPVAFNEDLMVKIQRKKTIARMIPKALEAGAVEIRYRPSFHVASGRFTRADCYLRLLTGEYGPVQSHEFMPIVEETGQINAVSQYAIRRVCGMIKELIDGGVAFETIAVPISPIQFLQERFVADVAAILKETKIPANRLAFEVAEGVALSAFASAQMRVSDLADMGIEIVLTEFGTGYSGVSNILAMPVKTVKLERMLLWQVDNHPEGANLVEGLIMVAHKLGVKVIAEGVETVHQVQLLQKFGCDYEQGFYYSPTLVASDLRAALEQ